jgi:hypothetical protein
MSGVALPRHLGRLLSEGFRVRVGAFANRMEYDGDTWDPNACRRTMQQLDANAWGGFQLLWPMPEQEVRVTSGPELVEAMLGIFAKVTPAMNLSMYAPCLQESRSALEPGPLLEELGES